MADRTQCAATCQNNLRCNRLEFAKTGYCMQHLLIGCRESTVAQHLSEEQRATICHKAKDSALCREIQQLLTQALPKDLMQIVADYQKEYTWDCKGPVPEWWSEATCVVLDCSNNVTKIPTPLPAKLTSLTVRGNMETYLSAGHKLHELPLKSLELERVVIMQDDVELPGTLEKLSISNCTWGPTGKSMPPDDLSQLFGNSVPSQLNLRELQLKGFMTQNINFNTFSTIRTLRMESGSTCPLPNGIETIEYESGLPYKMPPRLKVLRTGDVSGVSDDMWKLFPTSLEVLELGRRSFGGPVDISHLVKLHTLDISAWKPSRAEDRLQLTKPGALRHLQLSEAAFVDGQVIPQGLRDLTIHTRNPGGIKESVRTRISPDTTVHFSMTPDADAPAVTSTESSCNIL